jgi:hypothetical protein
MPTMTDDRCYILGPACPQSEKLITQRDEARAERDHYQEALERIAAYEAGHIAIARDALNLASTGDEA